MSMMDTILFWRRRSRRREVLAALAEAQLALDMVWVGEESSDPFLTSLRGKVVDSLKRIQVEIDEATNTQHLDSLADQIQVCAAKRAYWLDPGQLQTEAEACIRELQMWGVPQVYFDEHLKPLREAVRAAVAEATRTEKAELRKASVHDAQAALEALLLEYDYWDWYTSRYVKRILPWRYVVLGMFFLAGMLFALFFAFRWHMGVWAVACAGLAGTCASILLKEEPLVVYRDMIKSWIWAGSRLMTGLVATVVVMGLLSLGFISVGFSQSPDGNSGGLVPLHAVIRGCLDFTDQAPGVAPAQRPDAGAPDALPASGQSGIDAGEKARGSEVTPAVPAPRPCRKPSPCGNGAMLLVLGLAMLCGFSERAFVKILGQFEDRLGVGSEKGPQNSPPTGSAAPAMRGGANGEPAPTPQPPPSAQATGAIVTPDLPAASATVRPVAPSAPLQRIPTSPGLPAPASGPQPPKPPTKPSGT